MDLVTSSQYKMGKGVAKYQIIHYEETYSLFYSASADCGQCSCSCVNAPTLIYLYYY